MRLANLMAAAAAVALMTPAVSAAFGTNVTMTCRPLNYLLKYSPIEHCSVIVWHWSEDAVPKKTIDAQFSTPGWSRRPTNKTNDPTFVQDRAAFFNPGGRNSNYEVAVPDGMTADDFADAVKRGGGGTVCPFYFPVGPNSNTVAAAIVADAGGTPPHVPYALGAKVSACRRHTRESPGHSH